MFELQVPALPELGVTYDWLIQYAEPASATPQTPPLPIVPIVENDPETKL
jgi:hypothetical protein